jgi:hypothetical protein
MKTQFAQYAYRCHSNAFAVFAKLDDIYNKEVAEHSCDKGAQKLEIRTVNQRRGLFE